MLKEIKILKSHGIQYVKDLRNQKVAEKFRGRPVISNDITDEEKRQAAVLCPTGAIDPANGCLDLGRCVFAMSVPSPYQVK